MFKTYEPSGKTPPLVLAVFAGLAAVAVGASWVYSWLMTVVPFIYVNAAFTIVLAVGLWWSVGRAVHFGRCRNRGIAVALGAVVGVLTVCAAHWFGYLLFWDEALAEAQKRAPQNVGTEQLKAALEANIGSFWDYIDLRVETGWELSGRGGAAVSGPFVWLIWGIEAVVLVAFSAVGGLETSAEPYCESCDEWADNEFEYIFPNPSEAALQAVRDARDPDALVEPNLTPGRPRRQFLVYRLKRCRSCSDTSHLSVLLRDVTVNSQGEEEVDEHDYYTDIVLTAAQADAVRHIEMVDPNADHTEGDGPEGGQDSEGDRTAGAEPPGPMAATEAPGTGGSD